MTRPDIAIPPTERELIAIDVARHMMPETAGLETTEHLLGLLRASPLAWAKGSFAVADYILLREARIAAGIAP